MIRFLAISAIVAAFFLGYYTGLIHGHVNPAVLTTPHAAKWSEGALICAICLVFLLVCIVIEVSQ